MKTLILTLLLGFSCLVQAELQQLEPPEALLERARLSRIDYLDALRDLDKNVLEMRSRQEAEPYLNILPEFEKIAQESQMDELSLSSFKQVAQKLTRHCAKWLEVDKESRENVLKFHRYMSDAGAFEYMERFLSFLPKKVPSNSLMRLSENLDALFVWSRESNQPRYLQAYYKDVMARFALQGLSELNSGNDEELKFWVGKIHSPAGYADALTLIQSKLAKMKRDLSKDEALQQYTSNAHLILMLTEALQNEEFYIPEYLLNAVRETNRQALSKQVELELKIPEDLSRALYKNLQRKDLQYLSFEWTNPDVRPRQAYLPTFLIHLKILSKILLNENMSREYENVAKVISQIEALSFGTANDMEGSYALTTDNGRTYTFTLIFARDDKLVAGLGDPDKGFIFLAYYNVGYDVQKGEFVASEHEPSADTIRNLTIRFNISKGQISGRFFEVNGRQVNFTGSKVDTYSNYLRRPSPAPSMTGEGVYRGNLVCEGKSKPAVLYVETVNNTQLGRLEIGSGQGPEIIVQFNLGLREKGQSLVYLTTGGLSRRSFIHVRGQVTKQSFVGEYIIGGVGRSCEPLQFARVK